MGQVASGTRGHCDRSPNVPPIASCQTESGAVEGAPRPYTWNPCFAIQSFSGFQKETQLHILDILEHPELNETCFFCSEMCKQSHST